MPILPLAAAVAAVIVLTGEAASAKAAPCRATRAAYASLTHGMSYRRTVEHLGCPGRRVTHMVIGQTERSTYTWRGTGTYGANLTASFRNGHLTSKSQLGLN